MIEINYSSEVDKAKAEGRPIVALESTIITHGMPYPRNVETAQLVEQDIRDAGATPATMAVLNGILHVGLEPEQLQELGQAKNVAKISRADMAACIATGGTGATTVAATMIAARMAGISVFATGGIGGVHKGGATSFDISADLQELAQTPVNVICAGAKAILDLELTLEYLETQGVPVITYGQDTLPAFWSAQSDLTAPLRMDDLNEIAKAYCIRRDMGLPGGQLIANPIPVKAQIPIEELTPILAQAQQEADKLGVTGKAVTPFLLQRIFELTEGRSLEANIALVRNNAKLAAHLAKELHKLTK
ncbi:pseudouridine-5'-phosphate glycosidase [Epibacterium ulvae]|uniref:Pseudouridine-5'-phosphate glycosidase n=1 Tax=Epibacterium ulvae TaxID=1156985 RepID=A0A1G5Q857_9RHOB|nr:pseudouridine-5'-phosphate glycosidase [Epibacterium ulvae]SCZ58065.1 pseudouridine-5'-phosphate glycosidase [Epibacterium ulvae]